MTPELTKQAVEEFKVLFREEFGVDLTDKEATEKALKLLDLFKILNSKS